MTNLQKAIKDRMIIDKIDYDKLCEKYLIGNIGCKDYEDCKLCMYDWLNEESEGEEDA